MPDVNNQPISEIGPVKSNGRDSIIQKDALPPEALSFVGEVTSQFPSAVQGFSTVMQTLGAEVSDLPMPDVSPTIDSDVTVIITPGRNVGGSDQGKRE